MKIKTFEQRYKEKVQQLQKVVTFHTEYSEKVFLLCPRIVEGYFCWFMYVERIISYYALHNWEQIVYNYRLIKNDS